MGPLCFAHNYYLIKIVSVINLLTHYLQVNVGSGEHPSPFRNTGFLPGTLHKQAFCRWPGLLIIEYLFCVLSFSDLAFLSNIADFYALLCNGCMVKTPKRKHLDLPTQHIKNSLQQDGGFNKALVIFQCRVESEGHSNKHFNAPPVTA